LNFLQLVQRLHNESGHQGTAPATVTDQTGMAGRFVNWINDAYEDIFGKHETWRFRIETFSFDTISGAYAYSPASANINDLAAWHFNPDHNCLSGIRCHTTVAPGGLGQITDEADLIYVPWQEFHSIYRFGSHRYQTAKPTVFSVDPDNALAVWATPDHSITGQLTINGQYVASLTPLAENADIPVIPEPFHKIIMWRALMFYGGFEGSVDDFDRGQQEYRRMLAQLEFNQLPQITFGGTLA
jgi:hypothetical protein